MGVGDAGSRSAGKLDIFGQRMAGLGAVLGAGGAFAIGAGAISSAFISIGSQAVATSQRIDELIGRLGSLGDAHKETVRKLAFRHGDAFVTAAGELARVSGVDEFRAESETAGAIDLLGSSPIHYEEGARLAATISQAFEVGIKDALNAVGTIYELLGGERFRAIPNELLRSAETLGDLDSVTLQEFLGLVRSANTQISTPDALGEFLEDVGKELANPDAEIARLFSELGGNLLATLQAASGDSTFEKELGGLARTQLADVVSDMEMFGSTVEINESALLDLAKASTSLSDAFRLSTTKVSESVGDLVQGPVADFKNALLQISGNAHLASGELGSFGKALVSSVTLLDAAADITSQGLRGWVESLDDVLIKAPFQAVFQGRGDSAVYTGTGSVGSALGAASALPGLGPPSRSNLGNEFALAARQLYGRGPTPAAPSLQGRLGEILGRRIRESDVEFDFVRPPSQPHARSVTRDPIVRQALEEGFMNVAKEVKSVGVKVDANTVNRDENTRQVLEEQRLQVQGAC